MLFSLRFSGSWLWCGNSALLHHIAWFETFGREEKKGEELPVELDARPCRFLIWGGKKDLFKGFKTRDWCGLVGEFAKCITTTPPVILDLFLTTFLRQYKHYQKIKLFVVSPPSVISKKPFLSHLESNQKLLSPTTTTFSQRGLEVGHVYLTYIPDRSNGEFSVADKTKTITFLLYYLDSSPNPPLLLVCIFFKIPIPHEDGFLLGFQ